MNAEILGIPAERIISATDIKESICNDWPTGLVPIVIAHGGSYLNRLEFTTEPYINTTYIVRSREASPVTTHVNCSIYEILWILWIDLINYRAKPYSCFSSKEQLSCSIKRTRPTSWVHPHETSFFLAEPFFLQKDIFPMWWSAVTDYYRGMRCRKKALAEIQNAHPASEDNIYQELPNTWILNILLRDFLTNSVHFQNVCINVQQIIQNIPIFDVLKKLSRLSRIVLTPFHFTIFDLPLVYAFWVLRKKLCPDCPTIYIYI